MLEAARDNSGLAVPTVLGRRWPRLARGCTLRVHSTTMALPTTRGAGLNRRANERDAPVVFTRTHNEVIRDAQVGRSGRRTSLVPEMNMERSLEPFGGRSSGRRSLPGARGAETPATPPTTPSSSVG